MIDSEEVVTIIISILWMGNWGNRERLSRLLGGHTASKGSGHDVDQAV